MLAARRTRAIRSYTMIIALLVIWIVMSILTKGIFVTPRNLSDLFVQMTIVGVLATGMVLIIISGNIDLSVGSLLGMLGGFAAILQVTYRLDTITTLLLTLLLGVVVGVVQGSIISYLRVPAFIVTLGGLLAFRGVLIGVTNGRTISPVNESFRGIGQQYLPKLSGLLMGCAIAALLFILQLVSQTRNRGTGNGGNATSILSYGRALPFPLVIIAFTIIMNRYKGIPIPVLIMLGTIAVLTFVANRSVFGRSIYAIGGNKEAAVYSGISVNPIIFGIFVLQGALCAVGAAILTARLNAGTISAGQNLELDVIAAAVIGGASLAGGVGTVPGAMLGALVMASLNNGLSILNVESFWQYILKGIILVAAVYVDVLNTEKK